MPELTLTDNFISYTHYITEELLVHAGINHLLSLHLLFPHFPIEEYSLRNTGNWGLEAFHGILHGGTATLPITSANLSLQEFITLMNKAIQISDAEHELKEIDGNTIVPSKKKGRAELGQMPQLLCWTCHLQLHTGTTQNLPSTFLNHI